MQSIHYVKFHTHQHFKEVSKVFVQNRLLVKTHPRTHGILPTHSAAAQTLAGAGLVNTHIFVRKLKKYLGRDGRGAVFVLRIFFYRP